MRGLIFDFDDTLVETTMYFDHAKDKFACKMKELGFPVQEALDTLNKFDIRNVLNCGGFLKDCFPRALLETYQYYCDLHKRETCSLTAAWMEQLGWEVFESPVVLIEGAKEIINRLSTDNRLFLATKGDPEIQTRRLQISGLAGYFEKVYIMPDKTPVEYRRIAFENKIEPALSWVIGNSMKGDINPAIKAGYNCIHIYHHHTWDFEEEPAIGEFISIKRLIDIPPIIGS